MSQAARKFFAVAFVATFIALFHANGAAQDKAATAPAGQSAQSPDARPISDKDIQMLREDIRAQRKQLIAANMKLTPAQAEKFWPVYDQYVAELVANNNKKYALIKQFVQTGGVLTDTEADASVQQWVNIDQSVAELRQKYIPTFRKVLSAKDEALFYQLDRRVQLMIDLQLMALIPMIEPQQ
jgi:Spy/CpxP family protein refolding chaperone